MGYQESFVTSCNKKFFDDLVTRIKTIGFEYYEYHGCCPWFIVNVKKDIIGIHNKKIKLKKNKKYIYFTGERALQRRENRLLNIQDIYDEQWNSDDDVTKTALTEYPFDIQIIYVEEIDGEKMFHISKTARTRIFTGLNNEYIEVKDFLF